MAMDDGVVSNRNEAAEHSLRLANVYVTLDMMFRRVWALIWL